MRRNNEAGQTLVFAALGMTVLLGFTGLAVDMGVLRYQKRMQQTAADAAAIAGANQLRFGNTGITSASQDSAQANGFTDGGGGGTSACTSSTAAVGTVCVQVNNGPLSGPHAGDAKYVEVIVTEVRPTFFMKALSIQKQVVAARAVATLIAQQNSTGPGCIYTLGPPGTGIGIQGNGTPTVTAPTCGIADGGDWTTKGKPVNIHAGEIGVVGSVTNSGGGTVKCTNTSLPCPDPGFPTVTDPLVGTYTAPTVGSPVNWTGNPIPGTTYNSITINSTSVVNFPPGTYVIDGGAFTINGGATVCNQTSAGCSATGTPNAGVTFYLTNGASVTTNGNSNIYLAAPNSGPYTGLLFWQDTTDCSAATLNGTSNSYFQGALYFPGNPAAGCNVQLNFGGNLTNTTAAYTVIVTDDLKFFGTSNVTINSNYNSLPGGVFPIKNAILVE